ncbi:hypothetical protein DPMN_097747 [Dreissena polymorpha]|uniref:Uncharacterized protein n=1 Tax=Dreissena polymorpha TaxID=45954 RepID=A0A9D4LCC5_DREPO|nr:hypothetical protein DPMN_097747 [Dreissena polymorpha]
MVLIGPGGKYNSIQVYYLKHRLTVTGSGSQVHTFPPGNTHLRATHLLTSAVWVGRGQGHRERSQQASASIRLVTRLHIKQHDPAACACRNLGANTAWGCVTRWSLALQHVLYLFVDVFNKEN